MKSYSNELNDKILEFPAHVVEIVNEVLRINRLSEMEFDDSSERKHLMLCNVADILKNYELNQK